MAAKAWVLVMCLGSDGSCADDGSLTSLNVTANQCRSILASNPEGVLARCIDPKGRTISPGRRYIIDQDDDDGDSRPRRFRKMYYDVPYEPRHARASDARARVVRDREIYLQNYYHMNRFFLPVEERLIVIRSDYRG